METYLKVYNYELSLLVSANDLWLLRLKVDAFYLKVDTKDNFTGS